MADVLPLATSTSFPNPHSFGRSCSSIGSMNSTGTVQHHRTRSASGTSLSSLTSLRAPPFRRHDESTPSRSSSSHNTTPHRLSTAFDQRSPSGSYSQRTSFASALSSRQRSDIIPGSEPSEARLLDVAEDGDQPAETEEDGASKIVDDHAEAVERPSVDVPTIAPILPEVECTENNHASPSFQDSPKEAGVRRWLSTLRRRKLQSRPKLALRSPPRIPPVFGSRPASPLKERAVSHGNTDSQGSSLAFVSAVKSATATIASVSIATMSKGNSRWLRGHQRSSLLSGSDPRPSVDTQRSVVDEAAQQRSRKRRQKIEELIRTEESYIADIKALSNAYFTLIGHQPTSAGFARIRAQKNVSEMLHLHDELLGCLHRIVPFAEYDQRLARAASALPTSTSHTRWHSVDVLPARVTPARSKLASVRRGRRSLNISRSSDDGQAVLRCSPFVAAEVAKLFSERMPQFTLYEEYGANYHLILRDVEEVQRTTNAWPDFDKAIEALSAHVNPVNSREANRKKALTVKDLLIKPIQRLPRYELLFSDICRLTPVCDDPASNAEIQESLIKINATCRRMNEAKDDPIRSRMLESTWLLGDRLTFSNQVPRSIFLQLLGQVHLCGCLYIAYRSKERIEGSYVICILFGSTLLLASAGEDSVRYSTLAGIPLANATVVETDNGKGLQCYTAPYSWKLVFEYSARMYEIIMVACSAAEAEAWRQQIQTRIEEQSREVAEGLSNIFELQSPLIFDMRSVGTAFGKPSSFVRRMSVCRSATVGPTTNLNQIIIKNTPAVKDALDNSSNSSLQIPRSQSVVTPSHVQTLAPRRAERVRLEGLLSDVWTKDILPYPGMQPRLSDPIRASANHVIRKFSMASITSNFSSSKRCGSNTSIANSNLYNKEDLSSSKIKTGGRNRAYTSNKGSGRRPLVDFHNAPEAFLPADFELQDPSSNKRNKKSALRTFTMTMERPFSPLLGGNDSKTATLRRAQSVKEVVSSKTTLSSQERKEEVPPIPVYSVVQERAKTPAQMEKNVQPRDETVTTAKTPWKSKSRILRLFR